MKRLGRPENLSKTGNPGNKGGGRRPDWLKAKCKDIVDYKKLIEFLGDVASGVEVEDKVMLAIDGESIKVKVSASIKDRMRAIEILLERGWGQAQQDIVAAIDVVDLNISERKENVHRRLAELMGSKEGKI